MTITIFRSEDIELDQEELETGTATRKIKGKTTRQIREYIPPFAVAAQIRSMAKAFIGSSTDEATYYWVVSHSSNTINRSASKRPYRIEVLEDQLGDLRDSIAIHNLAQPIAGQNASFIESSSRPNRRGRYSSAIKAESGALPRQQPRRTVWFLECSRKLEELADLPENWDSYGAEPPNSAALSCACMALEVLLQIEFPPTRITPSVENGVGISFISGERYADIECFNTGEVLAVTSDRQGNPVVWEVESTKQGLESALGKIRVFLQS